MDESDLMARIYVAGQWYRGLSSSALLEVEFERLVLEHSAELFPEWHVVPFKADVASEESISRPDLALVDPLYRTWWVVEVEMVTTLT